MTAGGAANSGNQGKTACPVCGDAPGKMFAEGAMGAGKRYDVYFCDDCGIGVTTPTPSQEELQSFYRAGAYRAGEGRRFNRLVEGCIGLSREAKRRRVERFVSGGRILDIGCGRGLFLDVMRRRGWSVAGVEFDGETAEGIRRATGIDIESGKPDNWRYEDARFDVVTLNHVLEHIENPVKAIEVCGRLLRAGGLLVVAVPNAGSLQALLGRSLWFHLDPPYHLTHFSEKALISMLASHGFTVRKVRRFDVEYNPFGWLQTLLNLAGVRKNYLYDRLKVRELQSMGDRSRSAVDPVLTILLLPVFAPLALLLSVIESFLLCRGGTVEVFAKKT